MSEQILWNLAWHPSGSHFATCGQDRIIRIWSPSSDPQLISEFDTQHTRTIRCLCYSPCGRFLAAGSFDGLISIWISQDDSNHLNYQCIATLEGHENEVKRVAWSPDGRLLASCGRDKTVWIWQVLYDDDVNPQNQGAVSLSTLQISFECVAVHAEHLQDVKSVSFDPNDPLRLISTGYDDCIKIWHSDPSSDDDWICIQTLSEIHRSTVWDATFHQTDHSFWVATDEGFVAKYALQLDSTLKYHLQHRIPLSKLSIYSISMSSDNQLLAAAGRDRVVYIIDADSCELVHRYDMDFEINCLRWSPAPSDHTLVLVGDHNLTRILRI